MTKIMQKYRIRTENQCPFEHSSPLKKSTIQRFSAGMRVEIILSKK